jgi:hypothetical protein
LRRARPGWTDVPIDVRGGSAAGSPWSIARRAVEVEVDRCGPGDHAEMGPCQSRAPLIATASPPAAIMSFSSVRRAGGIDSEPSIQSMRTASPAQPESGGSGARVCPRVAGVICPTVAHA